MEAVGAVLLIPAVILIGVSIHLVYRIILGEWFLYPIRDLLRWLVDKAFQKWKGTQPGYISFTRLLGAHKVPFGYRRFTYSAIRGRDGVLEQQQRDRLDVLHATYAFFYLSAFECGVAAVYAQRSGAGDWKALAGLSAIMIVCAFGADLKQDIWECRLIRRNSADLKTFVEALGFK